MLNSYAKLFHKCHIALVTSYKLDSSGTSDQCELLSSLFEMQQVDVNQNLHWFCLCVSLNIVVSSLVHFLNGRTRGGTTSCPSRKAPRHSTWHPTSTLIELGGDGVAHFFQLLLLVFILILFCSLWHKTQEELSWKMLFVLWSGSLLNPVFPHPFTWRHTLHIFQLFLIKHTWFNSAH